MGFQGLGERTDDTRFRNPQSSREDTSFLRGIGSQMQAQTPSASDARASLHRRFTTNTVPQLSSLSPLSPIAQQRRAAAEPVSDLSSALEKKKLEFEFLREQRRRFAAEMQLIDLQSKREEDEMHRLAQDLSHIRTSGHQSEPTTPPEYRDNGFPSAFSRPSRFSSASMTSPPGSSFLSNRPSRAGSQVTSPPQAYKTQPISHISSKSMPGSRRNSDEEDDEDLFDYAVSTMNPRSGVALNRNSMPVTGYDLQNRFTNEMPDLSSVLGHINTAGFLFGDEDHSVKRNQPSPNIKSYLQMNTTDDKFPILVRRDGSDMHLSASSAALDLALSQSPGSDALPNGWPSFVRHRAGQHSMPMNQLHDSAADAYEPEEAGGNGVVTPTKNMAVNRHSLEVKFSPFGENKRPGLLANPPHGAANGMPKLQSSYSTNDIPTMKNTNGVNASVGLPQKTHAEQHFHNHNANMGRIPQNAVGNRQSRDLSGGDSQEQKSPYQQIHSALHAGAAPFGPTMTSAAANSAMTSSAMAQYAAPAYYGGYGMAMMGMGMGNMQQAQWNNQMPMYSGGYGAYGQGYQQFPQGRVHDNQSRALVDRRRRPDHGDDSRFANMALESVEDEILGLCKDQHGCRFLQKKLEDRKPEHVQLIFEKVNDYVVELMTDPFGNYLCQKLLEYTNDEQRTVLINNAAPQMVTIALNQHGTRALQKMIEFISTPEQIQTVIHAFGNQVVTLIQDLNGNHVIQKCLNHLSAQDAQFIFDAVGANCIIVGTHRHGCCVLQRCIDHASGPQKVQLVRQITKEAFALVQDPFGNYVVQYILDLNETSFTHPLCVAFRGHVPALSKQKFSSNVVEKCIRVADKEHRRLLIEELMHPKELEKLLRDPYANYVVQTAMDYADPEMKVRLIDAIRPILPGIRQTPYGRRIQQKIQDAETRRMSALGGTMSALCGSMAALDPVPAQAPLQLTAGFHTGFQNPTSSYATAANSYGANIAAPQPHRLSNPPLPNHLQNTVQQPFFSRGGQANGINYF
ncbi:hypothetical protein W97_01001 [Coniosporium apollinis CBS 100218]|uniref:PUM-HD domain-containing protein n=1 Tax=Coniosporium apollinis (strain CBS 100218) TaxID=1168221 RepID=R7YJ04_CONA1|nr:uncharacterized protein W97_01001 [Coniosporium apollinis CBS 100218]EON61784.1 hypothetical protein W97_01001 [Coniosporium apollinis CBS 100218]